MPKARFQKQHWNRKLLIALGLPSVLIPGVLLTISLGWNPTILTNHPNYNTNKSVFPRSGKVSEVVDGDTFLLQNGTAVRLLAVNAPDRGQPDFERSRQFLSQQIVGTTVNLEYDRYQDDQYGRVLAWVWVHCEAQPKFLPPDHMHLTYNTSRPGLLTNPEGCREGKLVNEEMVSHGLAKIELYKERGQLKYTAKIASHSAFLLK